MGGAEVLAAPVAAALLAAAGRGELVDEIGVSVGRPVLVVELTGGVPVDLTPPPGAAVAVVALDRSGTGPAPRGADVVLSARAGRSRPAPWVEVDDPGDASADLARRVGATPLAATTLVQVLRVGAGLAVADAVVLESLAYSTLQTGPEHRAWLAGRPAVPPRPAPSRPAVATNRVGDVLEVVIDRPERRNPLSVEVRDGLVAALNLAALDPSLQRVSIRGAGTNFCSGGDLAEFGSGPDPARAHTVRLARHVGLAVHGVAGRTTVHLHGPCMGAGVELAAFAGDVVAEAGTTLALPEVAMGLVPGAGGTVSVARRAGRERAAWLALGGAALDAATALAWGLVDRLGPPHG